MPRSAPTAELESVIAIITRSTNGASLDDIAHSLTPRPETRTLQRWLAKLIADGRVRQTGEARDSRYFPGAAASLPVEPASPPAPPPASAGAASAIPAVGGGAVAPGAAARVPPSSVASAARAATPSVPRVTKSAGAPSIDASPFQARFNEVIPLIVENQVGRIAAGNFAEAAAEGESDPEAFIRAFFAELDGLHEGNLARYGVTPAQFRAWKREWDARR